MTRAAIEEKFVTLAVAVLDPAAHVVTVVNAGHPSPLLLRAAGTVADPSPPVVTVVPWAELAAWGAGTLAVLALAGALATRALIGSVVR